MITKNNNKKGFYPNISVRTKTIEKYGIKNYNHPTEVIKKITKILKNTYLSTTKITKPITNVNTNMKIEVWKSSVSETFGNPNYYAKLPIKQKKAKIATMQYLAKMIKYGTVRCKEANNEHNCKSPAIYYYLQHPIKIDNQFYMVNMDIRKVPDSNGRFYIHSLSQEKIGANGNQNGRQLIAPISKTNISN